MCFKVDNLMVKIVNKYYIYKFLIILLWAALFNPTNSESRYRIHCIVQEK